MAPLLIALTIGLPWLGAAIVIGITNARFTIPNLRAIQNAVAIAFSVAAGLAALALLGFASSGVALRIPVGGMFGDFTFVPDGLGVFLAAVATVIGSLAVIFSVDYMHGEAQLGRYYALVLLFIGAMAGLVLTGSLLLLFVFWEITALCSYALISFHNDDPKAVAGGIKALIITQIGGIGLLSGALAVYATLGSYDIAVLLEKAGSMPRDILSFIAFGYLIAAAAKSAQVPFHTWLPDAMEAPTPVSALIHAATMVNAGVYLLARFYPAFAPVPGWTMAVIVVGMLSALMAAVMALVANDLKRVLAYSTISQLGFMVYAIGAGGIFASQFHLLSHAVFKALLFLGAGAVIHTIGTRDLRQMGGLGRQMPLVRIVFIIGALALAGLPILNGFWSKELVLEAGMSGGPAWAYIGMLIVAGLTALYSFRVVWMVFFGKRRAALIAAFSHKIGEREALTRETRLSRKAGEGDTLNPALSHKMGEGAGVHDAPTAMRVALIPLALATLTTWLLAGPFSSLLFGQVPTAASAQVISTVDMVREVITAPATVLALAVIGMGLAAWWWRDRLVGLSQHLKWLNRMATDNFGFEWINARVVSVTQNAAAALRRTQTGQLNWNIAGIVGGFIVVLVIVVLGSLR